VPCRPARFERSLPAHVDVERTGWGKRRKIKGFTIDLEPDRFRIEIDHRGSHAWIDHVVRGVCLKSEHVDMDRWLERLATALTREATRSAETTIVVVSRP